MNTKTDKSRFLPDYVVLPGETIQEIIDSLGMSQTELAERMGRPIKTVNEIIKGKASITPNTALQLERVLGVPASFWNNLEKDYQQSIAHTKEQEALKADLSWLNIFPLSEMIKRGWVKRQQDKVAQIKEVLSYFGVATVSQWKEMYSGQKIAYRESKSFKSHPGAVAAWIRQGQKISQETDTSEYDERKFRESLSKIRELTLESNPRKFIPKLKDLCAASGVVVSFVKELQGVKVCGATFWPAPKKACILLTIRYKTNDHLWFTFFHEAGHILYDGKIMVFDETIDNNENESEQRANNFACTTLIPPEMYKQLVRNRSFSLSSIVSFSDEIGVAPGIVLGRLQHDGYIPWASRLSKSLKVRYEWSAS